MSLTRTTMTADEATNLAATIDKSHLPVRVHRVTNDGIIELEDTNTGYILPIMSEAHWQQYARQQGGSYAIDDFANAGTALMAQLDTILQTMRDERDSLLTQAERVDENISLYQKQRDTIEAAIGSLSLIENISTALQYLPAPTPTQQAAPPRVTPARGPHKKVDGLSQQEWVLQQIQLRGPVRVGDLAALLAPQIGNTREQTIKSVSGMLTRLVQLNSNVRRVSVGTYEYHEEKEVSQHDGN